MAGADLIFCFRDKDFRFWKPDGPYNAVISSQPYFFQFAPTGWQEFSIENIINDKYWSVDRKVTAPATYVEDAGQILKNIFYKMGTKEEVFLVMAQQQLDYTAPPTAVFNFTAGGTDLVDGANTGTITGTPGENVYIKMQLNTTDLSDSLTGTINVGIGSIPFSITKNYSPYTLQPIIPASGSLPFSITFNNISTAATATVSITDKDGRANGSYGYWYKKIYDGQVDGSTFVHDGNYVTSTTLEEGLLKYLKANENTTLELPMSDAEAIVVKMDGIKLHEKSNFSILENVEVNLNYYGTSWAVPFYFVNNEGESTGVVTKSQNLDSHDFFSGGGAFNAYDNYAVLNANSYAVSFNLTGNIEFICTKMSSSPAYATRFRFYTSYQILSNQNDYDLGSTASMVVGQTYSIPYSLDVTLQPGESLYMAGIYRSGSGSNAGITFTENCKCAISYITRKATSYIKAFRLQTLFDRLVPFITDNKYRALASVYLNLMKDIVVTCGPAIRGFDDALMKINFTNLFQFLDSIDSVGIRESKVGSIKYIDIDRKENLVDNSKWIDLPEPAYRPKMSFAKKFFFNKLYIGYPELNTDVGALNGNEEFNCKYEFSTSTTLTAAEIDKVSNIRASCYEIEKIRVTTEGKNTTDFKSDKELYALCIEPTASTDPIVHYALDRNLNAGATGLIEQDTIFNLPISPKRNFNRSGSFLRSSSFRCDTLNLYYRTAEKNNKVVAGGIVEKADVNIGSLDNLFFYPIVIDAEFNVPMDWLEQLDENPRKVIRFPFMGIYWKTILMKSNFSPSSGASQSFQLMFTKENDINKLIEYFG